MLLSICIPTYNRAQCLKKTLNIYASQIKANNLFDSVEINISDNGSTDETKKIIEQFTIKNNGIKISYVCNEKNLGPDKNYIQAMNLAHGDYSILWSDDDYLKDGGLAFIIETISHNPDINLFLSNRTEWYNGVVYWGERKFLNEAITTRVFDFKDKDQLFLYLSSVISLGGLFSYIPAVVYKTNMINRYHYDGCLDGTFYAFLFYWWQDLLEGNKMMYINYSYIDCTLSVDNNNFGTGLKRVLVDYNGYIKLANILKMDASLKLYFLRPLREEHPIDELIEKKLLYPKHFESELVPQLLIIGMNPKEIERVRICASKKRVFRNCIIKFMPLLYNIYKKIHAY